MWIKSSIARDVVPDHSGSVAVVCAELRTRLQLTRPDWSLWFYRDQQNREADSLIQGPYERIRLLDAKWAETARSGAFAALDAVAAVLRNASGIIHVEVGLVGRNGGDTTAGRQPHRGVRFPGRRFSACRRLTTAELTQRELRGTVLLRLEAA